MPEQTGITFLVMFGILLTDAIRKGFFSNFPGIVEENGIAVLRESKIPYRASFDTKTGPLSSKTAILGI